MECNGICGLECMKWKYAMECKYGMIGMECMEWNTIRSRIYGMKFM